MPRSVLRVLFVEDNESDAALILLQLEKAGYAVISERVQTGSEMEAALDGKCWDIVISDYRLPQFNAPTALAQLRKSGCDIPFIVVSGTIGEETAVAMMKAGAHDYLMKDNLTRLAPVVERELVEAKRREEYRRSEQMMRASETRYRSLFENSPISLWEEDFSEVKRRIEALGLSGGLPRAGESVTRPYDASRAAELHAYFSSHPEVVRECAGLVKLLDVNQATLDLHKAGSKAELLINLNSLLLDDMLEKFQTELVMIAEGCDHFGYETTNVSFHGERIDISINWAVVNGHEDDLSRVIISVQDVSRRKQVERQLRQAETRLRSLVEQVPAIVYTELMGEPGRTVYMSPQIEALTGYPPDRYVSEVDFWDKVVHPDDLARFNLADVETTRTGEPFRLEYRILTLDGRTVWLRDEAVLIHDENGQVLFWQGVIHDITETKRVEAELRESERRLAQLMSNLPGMAYRCSFGPDWKMEFVSEGCLELTGYSPEVMIANSDGFPKSAFGTSVVAEERSDLLSKSQRHDGEGDCFVAGERSSQRHDGDSFEAGERSQRLGGGGRLFLQIANQDDQKLNIELIRAAVSQKRSYQLTYRICTFSGQEKWVWEQGQGIYDASGKPIALEGFIIDVTERKLAEAAIQRHLAEMEVLYQNSLAINRLMAPRQIAHKVIDILDGALDWHHIAIRLFNPQTGQVELLAINHSSLNQDELQAQESIISQSITGSGKGLSGWVYAHGQSVRSARVKEDSRYVETYPEICSGLYVPLRSGESIIGSISVESEVEDAFSEGDERLLTTVANQAAVSFENAQLFLMAQEELAARKAIEAELLQAHARLEQRVVERTADLRSANLALEAAARLKDEFLASMSHELRTPLTGILGLSEVLQLQTYGPLSEKQMVAMKHIAASGRQLLELINDILDISRIEARQLTLRIGPCKLAQICQSSLQVVADQTQEKKLQTSFSIDQASIVVQADAQRLKQTIVNLLNNAVKFTPDGGSIGIDVTSSQAEQMVHITVWDTGIGIRPEDLPRLFQTFVQLDASLARQYNGTGLGLALVKRLVELHAGSVGVESSFGAGSRFTVNLPWEG